MANGVEIQGQKPKGRPQVRRERADLLITGMIEAAQAINADPRMMHNVVKLSVFGSYLGDKPVLGDLDIAFVIEARWAPASYERDSAKFRKDFPIPPSLARDKYHLMFWPNIVVLRRLRVGRGISLHPQSDLNACGAEHRVIFHETAKDKSA